MEEIIAIAIILVTAFVFAPLGLGGGFLFVPTLYFILGMELQLSIVCSLILVWFVLNHYLRKKLSNSSEKLICVLFTFGDCFDDSRQSI